MNESIYITNKGVKFTINELLRSEWAKANELTKPKSILARFFYGDLEFRSFCEGFNAGMVHMLSIQHNEIKLVKDKDKQGVTK